MRSSLRSLLLAVLITIGACVSAIFIAWIVLSTVGDAIRWSEFFRRFEIGLTIGRALFYSALFTGWWANRKRQQQPARRQLLDRTGLAGFASILLVELNRIQG